MNSRQLCNFAFHVLTETCQDEDEYHELVEGLAEPVTRKGTEEQAKLDRMLGRA